MSQTYLSSPWRPAALFDLPNHGGHQEQGQEAAVDGQGEEGGSQKEEKKDWTWTRWTDKTENIWVSAELYVSFCHTYINQWTMIFFFELMHIHGCLGLTALDRRGDYSPHWSVLLLNDQPSVFVPPDEKKVISCCCAIISTTFKALLRYHYSLSLHSAACQSDKIITNCQRIIEVIQKFFSKKYTSICCEYKTIRFKNTVCATKLWTWSNTKYIFTVTVYKITEDDLTWV